LNVGLGSDDEISAVTENRARIVDATLPGADLSTVFQVHSANVETVSDLFDGNRPEADAMVTDRPGILLGILTADCVPVLFADIRAGIIGAAHSGWKGSIAGVSEATVTAMENLGADRNRITTAIGPCIAQKSYEVDDGFFRRFADDDATNERFFSYGKPGHYQFDIEGYVAASLAKIGISTVECLSEDTYSQPNRFFSYRRTCHNNEVDYGRQISVIGLAE